MCVPYIIFMDFLTFLNRNCRSEFNFLKPNTLGLENHAKHSGRRLSSSWVTMTTVFENTSLPHLSLVSPWHGARGKTFSGPRLLWQQKENARHILFIRKEHLEKLRVQIVSIASRRLAYYSGLEDMLWWWQFCFSYIKS